MASEAEEDSGVTKADCHVTPIHVEVTEDEVRCLTSLEGWLGGGCDKAYNEDLMRSINPAELRTTKKGYITIGRTRDRKPKFLNTKYAMLGVNRVRPDKTKPPTCILCLRDNQPSCGTIFWLPEYPDFFAVHELCLVMNPILSALSEGDEQTDLTRKLCGFPIKDIQTTSFRGNRLTCTKCRMFGALLGCFNSNCQKSYHAPCAIEDNCAMKFSQYRCYCSKHIPIKMKEAVEVEDGPDDDCPVCLEPVKRMKKFGEVVKTTDCRSHYIHYACMKIDEISSDPDNDDGSSVTANNNHTGCYYDQGYSRRQPKCLGPKGPRTYYGVGQVDETKNIPFESLNACEDCGFTCHRLCAGPPWSEYCYDPTAEDNIEEVWKCESCRDDPSLVQSVERNIEAERRRDADESIVFLPEEAMPVLWRHYTKRMTFRVTKGKENREAVNGDVSGNDGDNEDYDNEARNVDFVIGREKLNSTKPAQNKIFDHSASEFRGIAKQREDKENHQEESSGEEDSEEDDDGVDEEEEGDDRKEGEVYGERNEQEDKDDEEKEDKDEEEEDKDEEEEEDEDEEEEDKEDEEEEDHQNQNVMEYEENIEEATGMDKAEVGEEESETEENIEKENMKPSRFRTVSEIVKPERQADLADSSRKRSSTPSRKYNQQSSGSRKRSFKKDLSADHGSAMQQGEEKGSVEALEDVPSVTKKAKRSSTPRPPRRSGDYKKPNLLDAIKAADLEYPEALPVDEPTPLSLLIGQHIENQRKEPDEKKTVANIKGDTTGKATATSQLVTRTSHQVNLSLAGLEGELNIVLQHDLPAGDVGNKGRFTYTIYNNNNNVINTGTYSL